jgi:hypothetical protein
MDWATGILIENKKLVAETVNHRGNHQICALEGLAASGIPSVRSRLSTRNNVSTSFDDWEIVPPNRYLAAYHYRILNKIESQHQIFEFQERATKFLVPALVLIRAMFYPNNHLLSSAFRPQCLDNLGFLDGDIFEPATRIVRVGKYKWFNNAVRARLGWMYAFPSAYRMAHSIHEHAMNGVIGISLPNATFTWVVVGRKLRNTYYVTAMSPSQIFAQEPVFDYRQNMPPTVLGYEANRRRRADKTIPLRDGVASVSDEEWEAIAPILLKRSSYRFHVSQRDLLDCVLEKLCSGATWRTIPCKSGNYVTVTQAYRSWKNFGTFEPALEQLKMMRRSA